MYDEKITLHREDADSTKQITVDGNWSGYKLTFGAKGDKELLTPLQITLRNALAGGSDELTVTYNATTNITTIVPKFLPVHTRQITKQHNYYEVQAVKDDDVDDIHTIARGVMYVEPDVINAYNGTAVDPVVYVPVPIDAINELEVLQKYEGSIRGINPEQLVAENVYNKTELDLILDDKADLVDGKVPSSQLPGYSDEILEYADYASLPGTGETGKIYVTLDTNIVYRWSGSAYIEISASLALGETSATAYRGDRGKTAYDHSQAAHAPADAQKNSDITKAEIEAKLTGEITSHSHDKTQVGLGNVDNTSDANKPISTAQQSALDIKADLVDGKVPSSQLPSYTDEVTEYADYASLPGTGETGKIYVTLDTNIVYRWSGSAYIEISASLALGETSATAYRGDRGKTAYDHSQATHAPANAQKNSDITKAEIEAKLTGEITSHSHASSGGLLPDGTVTGATTQAQAFTNGIIAPTITGGTGVSSKITYKSTTGAGTTTAIAHQFTGGTNGGTVIMAMLNDGNVGIGYTSTAAKLSVNGSISAGSSSRVATGSGVHVSYGGAFETNNGSTSIAYYMPADPADNYSSVIRNSYSDGQIKFNVSGGIAGGNVTKITITKDGKIGLGIASPTAILHLSAGTASVNTAPIKLTTGPLNTTAEAGSIEYNNTFHLTNSDATRRHFATAPNATKVTASAPYANDGYVVVNIGGTDFNVMTTAA